MTMKNNILRNSAKLNSNEISALIDGELTAEEQAQIMSRIDNCSECREVYESEKNLKALIKNSLQTNVSDDKLRRTIQSRLTGSL